MEAPSVGKAGAHVRSIWFLAPFPASVSTRAEGTSGPDSAGGRRAVRGVVRRHHPGGPSAGHRIGVPAQLGSPGRDRRRPAAGDHHRRSQEDAELEREVRELRRANEILKAASAFFARELDPRPRMNAFIDAHRDRFGVEPICRVLQAARRPTTPPAPGRPRPAPSAMSSSRPTSSGSTPTTTAATAPGRSTGSCAGRARRSLGVPCSG